MRIRGFENIHLTYCLNVHPGSTLEEAEVAIFERAPLVFEKLSELADVGPPFGLGMWLSADAARALFKKGKLEALARKLQEAGLYAFTLNGFPYGRFHGTRVKERVYKPDWADDSRCDYTGLLAHILAKLLPEGVRGTISTLPVTFAPWATDERITTAATNLALTADSLDTMYCLTGSDIALALEPEPGCYLETTDDVIRFFEGHLVPAAARVFAEKGDPDPTDAEDTVRRHIGVCLDTTHTGVVCESPKEAIERLSAHGIRVCKIQLGAALSVNVGEEGPPEPLDAFKDEVYLHQVVARTDQGDVFFADLPEALEQGASVPGEWRVHFHVPLSWPGEGPIATTRDQVDEAFLAAAIAAGVEHFESEIYTLDVFPAARESTESILAQDLAWLWRWFEAVRS
jgi:sugar phosphate isomerase/epimerase